MTDWQSDDPASNPNVESTEADLARLPLGSGPENKSKLMYACGFAAGVASVRELSVANVRRWQMFSIAASILAVGSIAIQLPLSKWGSETQSPKGTDPSLAIVQSDESRQAGASFDWQQTIDEALASSSTEHTPWRSALGVTSTSSLTEAGFTDSILSEADKPRPMLVPDDQQQIFTPRDYPKLF